MTNCKESAEALMRSLLAINAIKEAQSLGGIKAFFEPYNTVIVRNLTEINKNKGVIMDAIPKDKAERYQEGIVGIDEARREKHLGSVHILADEMFSIAMDAAPSVSSCLVEKGQK